MYARTILFLFVCMLLTNSIMAQTNGNASRYASHSVLAQGKWVKIRIPETGVYQVTDSLAQAAGFTDAQHVSVWGYGGALQPELLTDSYLRNTDDLKPVTTYYTDGRRLFHGVGPVNWNAIGTKARERNFYSNHGYYFLTETDGDNMDEQPKEAADSTEFAAMFYPSANDYHALHEVDEFAWYAGGRQLYESQIIRNSNVMTVVLPAYSENGTLTLAMAFKKKFTANIYVNDSLVSTITPGSSVVNATTGNLVDGWAKAGYYSWKIPVSGLLRDTNTISIEQEATISLRLDYVALNSTKPKPMTCLSDKQLPCPEIVGLVPTQDRHADPQADMVIIIPANRLMLQQAERLKALHEKYDSLRVNIVPADELYNEFSSGTPDGNAYRRYMKMLYDRAETDADRPRYLLMMGDGAFDNRLILSDWGKATQDDYLLCYESENSVSETRCYTSDDYFALLADGKGKSKDSMLRTDQLDLAVGRLPVSTTEQAQAVVDKIVAYYENKEAGPWQNLLCFMADDGNQNMHMNDAEVVIAEVEKYYSGFNIQKVYWDAYKRQTSVSGDRYPDVERIVQQNMQDGALLMNYTGHGGPRSLSHEYVLRIADFESIETKRLPFWVTASCDIMAFDGHEATLGETALLAPRGGAIGFFGTARTVYAFFNQYMNRYFTRYLLGTTNGRKNTIGEAAQMAKNTLMANGDDQTENKFQYVLLGDPALSLAMATEQAVIDSINKKAADSTIVELSAGRRVNITGTIAGQSDFNGKLYITVFDAEQTVVGQMNNKNQTDTAIVFRDYPNVIYSGTQTVSNGHFNFSFNVTRELSYTDATAKIILHAISDDLRSSAHGEIRNIKFVQSTSDDEEGEGPVITCYLNDPSFDEQTKLLQQPLFVAEISDEDGINTTGSGIGHDLELVIDKKIAYTYNLNNLFEPLEADGTRGRVEYRLPELTYGQHQLRFRAWDLLNNSSSVTLRFEIYNPLGIDQTTAQQQESAVLFDTAGRQLDKSATPRKGLYIMRNADGQVKKISGSRQ